MSIGMNDYAEGIGVGYFCYLKKKLVYVNRISGTMAYVTDAYHPTWHKKVPACMLKARKDVI